MNLITSFMIADGCCKWWNELCSWNSLNWLSSVVRFSLLLLMGFVLEWNWKLWTRRTTRRRHVLQLSSMFSATASLSILMAGTISMTIGVIHHRLFCIQLGGARKMANRCHLQMVCAFCLLSNCSTLLLVKYSRLFNLGEMSCFNQHNAVQWIWTPFRLQTFVLSWVLAKWYLQF